MASSDSHNNTGSHGEEKKYSTSELMASAKIVAEAAQSSFGKGGSADQKPVDKAKVAAAAGDLLDAVGQYAKLDDQKGLGQYVDKAADYLHGYNPNTTTAAAAPPSDKPDHHKGDHPAKSEGGDGGHGGLADGFVKVAGGFFK